MATIYTFRTHTEKQCTFKGTHVKKKVHIRIVVFPENGEWGQKEMNTGINKTRDGSCKSQ